MSNGFNFWFNNGHLHFSQPIGGGAIAPMPMVATALVNTEIQNQVNAK